MEESVVAVVSDIYTVVYIQVLHVELYCTRKGNEGEIGTEFSRNVEISQRLLGNSVTLLT